MGTRNPATHSSGRAAHLLIVYDFGHQAVFDLEISMLKISSPIRAFGTSLLLLAATGVACSPSGLSGDGDDTADGGSGSGSEGSGGLGSGGLGTGGNAGIGGTGTGGLGTGGEGTGGIGTGGVGTGGEGTGGDVAGTGGASTLPPEAIIFKEDFEGASEDSVPAGWNSFVSYVVDMNNTKPEPFALADSTKAHGGSMALHVSATSAPAMLTRPLPNGTNKIYVRAFVWLTNRLGQNPANNHETLIGVRGTPGGANDEVRFGEIKGVIGTNEVPSDDISPTQDQWGMGPIIAAGEWNCIEVAFRADLENHEVRAWNNGTEVHAVGSPEQWNNGGLGSDFLTGKFSEFIIGWHSFSNYANEIWFDDIIVATEPIGCDAN